MIEPADQADPLEVRCRRCDAPPGQRCTYTLKTEPGVARPRKPHPERRDDARLARAKRAEAAARDRGEQLTACQVCHRLIPDPLLWGHRRRHTPGAAP